MESNWAGGNSWVESVDKTWREQGGENQRFCFCVPCFLGEVEKDDEESVKGGFREGRFLVRIGKRC